MFGTCETNIIHIAWIALSIWFACVIPTECDSVVCFVLVCTKPWALVMCCCNHKFNTFGSFFLPKPIQWLNDKRRPEAVLMPGIRKYSPKSRWSCIQITNIFSESPINDSMDILFVHTIATFFQLRRQQSRYRIQNRRTNVCELAASIPLSKSFIRISISLFGIRISIVKYRVVMLTFSMGTCCPLCLWPRIEIYLTQLITDDDKEKNCCTAETKENIKHQHGHCLIRYLF